jgi:asparagine synthase (glutamine-hydrolysing)
VDDPPAGGIDEWVEELRELLRLAVVSRLESDVPIGVFLSGGIDSSAIAALASASVKPSRLSTFTIGFNDLSFDERTHAEAVATIIGSKHDVQICDLDFMRDSAGSILSRTGDLLGDPSLIPTTLLSAGAAMHVKVALSGDGGDELFAGYDPFKALSRARLYQKFVPRVVHSAIRSLAAFMPIVDSNMSLDFKVRRALRGLSFEPRYWNPIWLAPLGPDEIATGFEVKFDTEEIYNEAIALWDSSGSNDIDRTLEFFTCIYLPDNILVKSDRAGMMNSLEIRAPFLSLDLVEFVRRLPASVKYRNGTTKWILKEALRPLLPSSIVDRRKKGFGIPVSQWLRDMDGRPSLSIEGIREATFDAWDAAHRARREDHRGALWCRKVLEHYIAGENANLSQAN